MKAAVYKADDQAFAQPVWTSTGAFSARKNYFDGRGKRSYLVDNTAWEGTNAKGEKVADGHYIYEVRYTPAVPGAEEQVVRFNVKQKMLAMVESYESKSSMSRPLMKRGP